VSHPTPPPAEPLNDEPALDAPDRQALRRRAEALALTYETGAARDDIHLSRESARATLHELRVHQVELEIQNEELRQAKDALDASRARYVDLYDLAPVGYCSVNEGGLITQANLTLASLLGVTRSTLAMQPPFSKFVIAEDQTSWYRLYKLLREADAPQTCELRLRPASTGTGDGSPGAVSAALWGQLAVTVVHDDTGARLLHMAVSDISERKRAEAKIHLAASVFGHAREGIFITDNQGIIIDVNDAYARITGYAREEAIGKSPRILNSGRHDHNFYAAMWSALIEQGHWSGEIWNRRKNGEVFAELQTISAVRDAQGKTQQYVALFSDISAIKAHQGQLEHIAHFDALTDLPNRLLLADRLQQAMSQATRRQQHLAVAYLDLDGFKSVNDHHGHDVGDSLLIALSHAMKASLREGDTLARIGGDEFVAVLIDLESTAGSVPMLSRLLNAAATPVHLGNLVLQSSASVGVTFYPQPQPVEADQLLRQADQAMYQAKLAGKNRYHVFDAALDSSIRGHHESLERIRTALEQHEFVLHYQPKVNMHSGKVIGAEALIRWQHPEKGLLAPATFLPVIEDDPLALDVGEWVIDAALTQIAAWHTAGLDLPVSINIGARQLQQDNFVEHLQTILARHPQVNPTKLELEVLETSALEDITRVSRVIEDCAKIGVKFALDDFGTGYSSLTYLKRLQVALLKIDQSFVRDMLEDRDDLAILQGVIGLAAAFKREVIAEGVETVAHGTALVQLGCKLAQGYGIARPMPAEQMPAWVATWQPDAAWYAQA
jgi:diguanylate cyclase (GGDEF)-like protein/PAS domain S-box-containing protein